MDALPVPFPSFIRACDAREKPSQRTLIIHAQEDIMADEKDEESKESKTSEDTADENAAKVEENLDQTEADPAISEDDRESLEELRDKRRKEIAESADTNELHIDDEGDLVNAKGQKPKAEIAKDKETKLSTTGRKS